MAIRSNTYYWLECTNRIDNIVAGECGTRSPGAWGDQDAMELVAIERGWVKTGRGHSCPTCAASELSAVKPARKTKVPAEATGTPFDGHAA